MLRKRARYPQLKDPQMAQLTGGDTVSESKFYSFFNVLTCKALESDSVRSPTSPLDFRVFSNLTNHFRSQKSSNKGHRKTWFRNKVGLGIIDSPDFETEHSGKVLRASDSKNITFNSSQNSIGAPKSAPNYTGASNSFEIEDNTFELESSVNVRSFSFDSEQSGSNFGDLSKGSSSFLENCTDQKPVIESIGSVNHLINNIPPSEIELSEDYTCVRVHGSNPKVTHIFGDCILTCNENNSITFVKNKEDEDVSVGPQTDGISKGPYSPSDFLRFCYSCNKSLDGEDIYMYRGEKAFCSENCRLQEILIDEEMEKINTDKCKDFAKNESSESSWFIST